MNEYQGNELNKDNNNDDDINPLVTRRSRGKSIRILNEYKRNGHMNSIKSNNNNGYDDDDDDDIDNNSTDSIDGSDNKKNKYNDDDDDDENDDDEEDDNNNDDDDDDDNEIEIDENEDKLESMTPEIRLKYLKDTLEQYTSEKKTELLLRTIDFLGSALFQTQECYESRDILLLYGAQMNNEVAELIIDQRKSLPIRYHSNIPYHSKVLNHHLYESKDDTRKRIERQQRVRLNRKISRMIRQASKDHTNSDDNSDTSNENNNTINNNNNIINNKEIEREQQINDHSHNKHNTEQINRRIFSDIDLHLTANNEEEEDEEDDEESTEDDELQENNKKNNETIQQDFDDEEDDDDEFQYADLMNTENTNININELTELPSGISNDDNKNNIVEDFSDNVFIGGTDEEIFANMDKLDDISDPSQIRNTFSDISADTLLSPELPSFTEPDKKKLKSS